MWEKQFHEFKKHFCFQQHVEKTVQSTTKVIRNDWISLCVIKYFLSLENINIKFILKHTFEWVITFTRKYNSRISFFFSREANKNSQNIKAKKKKLNNIEETIIGLRTIRNIFSSNKIIAGFLVERSVLSETFKKGGKRSNVKRK